MDPRTRGPATGGLRRAAMAFALAAAGLPGCNDSAGGASLAALLEWNRIAIDASGLDHTPVAPGETRVFAENYGPGRASRAMAIVHVAMFEAVNAIAGGYESYAGVPRAPSGASMRAAIAQAAHDTLVSLYPSQEAALDDELARAMDAIPDGPGKAAGADLGRDAAAAILAMRAADGSLHAEPLVNTEFICSDQPGFWRQDPVSLHRLALGARWAEVSPFVLDAASQFRAPPTPRSPARSTRPPTTR